MAEKKFETLLNELQRTVTSLENGECGLEDTLKLYEKGVKLAADCNKILDNAEQKIRILSKTDNGLEEVPFENDGV